MEELSERARLELEVEHLRRQVTELQERGTRLIEEQRADDISHQLHAFRSKFGYVNRTTPMVPVTTRELVYQLRLITEEYFELMEAAFDGSGWSVIFVRGVRQKMMNFIEMARPEHVALDKYAKESADLDYVNENTRKAFGIPRKPIAAEVHSSNMAKEGGEYDAHGKLLKPPGWKSPMDAIRQILFDHGWSK